MTETKPVHSIRYGNVQVAVRRNESAAGPFYNVTMTRRYREGDSWHDSSSVGESDLPTLAKAILDAHSAIQALPRESLASFVGLGW